MAEDEGGSGFIKSGGAGNLAGVSPGYHVPGQVPRLAPGSTWRAIGRWQGTCGGPARGERREETLDWDGGGVFAPKVVSQSLWEDWDIWTSGHFWVCGTDTWDRHTLGHWGPLSWASPKVAEPMGISRAQQQRPWKRASIPRWSMVIALGGQYPALTSRGSFPQTALLTGTWQGAWGMEWQGG